VLLLVNTLSLSVKHAEPVTYLVTLTAGRLPGADSAAGLKHELVLLLVNTLLLSVVRAKHVTYLVTLLL
jgi:hypothetical protein